MKKITIRGARIHNLKDLAVTIPRNRLVVFTGMSGSGKTSLAYDTIFSEGQRRYFETLSAYFRQFVVGMEKPDVDSIEGLSPSISVDQRGRARSGRSTVGTITETSDYLRLLFTAIGKAFCPDCEIEIQAMTPERMVEAIVDKWKGRMVGILAPVVVGRKGTHRELVEGIGRRGYQKIRVDGKIYNIDDEIKIARYKTHDIEVVVDRLGVENKSRARLLDSVRLGAKEGGGGVYVLDLDGGEVQPFSTKMGCPRCGLGLPPVSPRLFSFNSPSGACKGCHGMGVVRDFDPELVVPDRNKGYEEGAIAPFSKLGSGYEVNLTEAALKSMGFGPDKPLKKMRPKQREVLMNGGDGERLRFHYRSRGRRRGRFATASFPGVLGLLRERFENTNSMRMIEFLEGFQREQTCGECGGSRLRPEALAFRVGGKNIHEISRMPVSESVNFLKGLKLSKREEKIGGPLFGEVLKRLLFLEEVGLPYLTLDRPGHSLSGGEYQRVRLAAQTGTHLSGVTYILDEPSIGLHPRDGRRLLRLLKQLRDMGNTIIVVEHDEYTIRQADHVVDLGPRAGRLGGELVGTGTPRELEKNGESLTGQYLSGRRRVEVPEKRRKPHGHIELKGARGNNLKDLDLRLPTGVFVCFTGVSGSGKSSLALDTLYPALREGLGMVCEEVGLPYRKLGKPEGIDRVVVVDSAPIGKTSRSTPATYTRVFGEIRRLFSLLPEARARGYRPGRFSYNVKGGRCEACEGHGVKRVEMHFLPDVFVTCKVCGGRRYNHETLEVRYKGKSIGDVLGMTVDEALEHFENVPKVARVLEVLSDIGLGYLLLGQPAPSLSAGEAQRIKLSAELSGAGRRQTAYLLDEPTTGLHFSDIEKLLHIIDRLIDRGNTVVVIEHNLDVVKYADYIIDMGPEGGEDGGRIIAEGTPEKIAKAKSSYTGKYLAKYLKPACAKVAKKRAKQAKK